MAIDISHLPSLDQIEKMSLKNSGTDISHLPSLDQIEKTPVPSVSTPGALESLVRGGLQGVTANFADEGLAGISALGRSIVEKDDDKKSFLENLYSRYKEEKAFQEEKERLADEKHGFLYGSGELAGSFVPAGLAFKGLKGASMAAKIGTGAGMGALVSMGDTKQDDQNKMIQTLVGAGTGAIAVPVAEKILAPIGSYAVNKVGKVLGDSSTAKQLAAVFRNADKGGSIFGESGPLALTQETKDLSKKYAQNIVAPIKKEVDNMGAIFKQNNAQRLGSNIPTEIQKLREEIVSFSPGYNKWFEMWEKGLLDPSETNNFRKEINHFKYVLGNDQNPQTSGMSRNILDKINQSNIVGELEAYAKRAGTDIAQLNKNIHEARNIIEPFIDTAGKIVDKPVVSSSNYTEQELINDIQPLLQGFLEKGGRSTSVGDKGRFALASVQEAFEKAGLPNPSQAAKELQENAYLNAARMTTAGNYYDSNTSGVGRGARIIGEAAGQVFDPYINMERIAKNPIFETFGIKDKTRKITENILNKDPKQMLQIGLNMKNDPRTAKLGQMMVDEAQKSIETGKAPSASKLVNVAFQVSQMPSAKKMLEGMFGGEEE